MTTIKRILISLPITLFLLFSIPTFASTKDVNQLLAKSWGKYYDTAIVNYNTVKVDDKTESYDDFMTTLEQPTVKKRSNGSTVITSPYQTKRIVTHQKLSGFGEIDRASCSFLTVLYFKTEEDTKNAYQKIIRKDPTAYVDKVISAKKFLKVCSYSDGVFMGMDNADYYNNFGNSKVTVAILDTGLTTKHPLFKNRKISKYSKNIIDNNNNYTDNFGHGTGVAGVIADCTPKNVQLMPIKVLDDQGYGSYLTISLGLYYAIQNNADIINMSFGSLIGTAQQDEIMATAYKKNILMFASSGNESLNFLLYPASSPFVISVGSYNTFTGKRSDFSNYGSNLDFTAPGDLIVTAWHDGSTVALSGTSLSTPHVSAAAAYLKLINKDLTVQQAYKELKRKAKDKGAKGKDIYYGWGVPRVNLSVNYLFKKQLKTLKYKKKIKLTGNLKKNFYIKYKKKYIKVYRKKDKKLFYSKKIK